MIYLLYPFWGDFFDFKDLLAPTVTGLFGFFVWFMGNQTTKQIAEQNRILSKEKSKKEILEAYKGFSKIYYDYLLDVRTISSPAENFRLKQSELKSYASFFSLLCDDEKINHLVNEMINFVVQKREEFKKEYEKVRLIEESAKREINEELHEDSLEYHDDEWSEIEETIRSEIEEKITRKMELTSKKEQLEEKRKSISKTIDENTNAKFKEFERILRNYFDRKL